jgi:hypothetical protein
MTGPKYMPVTGHLVGNLDEFDIVYTGLGCTFTSRSAAIAWGIDKLNHDDFRIATLVDGRLAAIGWGQKDFDPIEENLPAIARQLSLEVAA